MKLSACANLFRSFVLVWHGVDRHAVCERPRPCQAKFAKAKQSLSRNISVLEICFGFVALSLSAIRSLASFQSRYLIVLRFIFNYKTDYLTFGTMISARSQQGLNQFVKAVTQSAGGQRVVASVPNLKRDHLERAHVLPSTTPSHASNIAIHKVSIGQKTPLANQLLKGRGQAITGVGGLFWKSFSQYCDLFFIFIFI